MPSPGSKTSSCALAALCSLSATTARWCASWRRAWWNSTAAGSPITAVLTMPSCSVAKNAGARKKPSKHYWSAKWRRRKYGSARACAPAAPATKDGCAPWCKCARSANNAAPRRARHTCACKRPNALANWWSKPKGCIFPTAIALSCATFPPSLRAATK